MNALVIFLVISFAVLVIELLYYWLAPVNRVIDAVGEFWGHCLYSVVLVVIAYTGSLLNLWSGIFGIAVGIVAAMVIHDRLTQPVPLTFFTHLSRGEDTQ